MQVATAMQGLLTQQPDSYATASFLLQSIAGDHIYGGAGSSFTSPSGAVVDMSLMMASPSAEMPSKPTRVLQPKASRERSPHLKRPEKGEEKKEKAATDGAAEDGMLIGWAPPSPGAPPIPLHVLGPG